VVDVEKNRNLVYKNYTYLVLLIIFGQIFIGWCLVWKLHLSKFKLVRELFSQQAPEVDSSSETKKTK